MLLVQQPKVSFNIAALEALVIRFFVGGSFLFAQLMKFDNPYWMLISCAAVMQGSTFRAIWQRKIHRILGTIIGIGLTWLIFYFSPNAIEIGLLIFALNFMVELLVVRNYTFAVVFVTPLTVLFAESISIGISPNLLVVTRLSDIVVGSAIGIVGGWLLRHHKLFNLSKTV